MTKPTYITIAQAEASKSSSVWAINGSGGTGVPKGVLNITVTEGNGRPQVVKLPVTSIPMDITTQATRLALLTNPDFRRLVARGLVRLVSEETAMHLLDNDLARAEQRRLLEQDYAHTEDVLPSAPQEVKSIMDEAAGSICAFAMNLAHTTDGDEDNLVASLRNNADTLSKLEFQYIVNNSTFAKVKGAAAELAVA